MRYISAAGAVFSTLIFTASSAEAAQIDAAALKSNIDMVWVAAAAALVLLMQIGFMFLEGGLVRSKNSINVAQKNLADFSFSVICFMLLGFALMFGASAGGYLGFSSEYIALGSLTASGMVFFVFQAMFCGTAATIVSGAVAERFTFPAYLFTIPLIAIVIYPVFGHWAWGNLLIGDNPAFLADMGFVDFAGSTVVHSIGAWVALAAVLAVGPRLNRYNENGEPVQIHGHNTLLATAGAFLLYLGWLGFNAGSTLVADESVPPILLNTVVSGAAGAVVGMIIGRQVDGLYRPERVINGLLGGLVGVTAGVAAVDVAGALIMGAVGGLIANLSFDWLERRGVDDAVGAIAVHGVAGVWGTIGFVLIAPMEALPLDSRLEQLGVQMFGSAVAFVYAFSIAWAWFAVIKHVIPLRVSEEDERIGLNAAEHGTTLGTGKIQELLQRLAETDLVANQRIEVEPGDESSELAELFNRLLANIEAHDQQRKFVEEQAKIIGQQHAAEQSSYREKWRAERDLEREVVKEISEIVERVAAGELDRRANLTTKTKHLVAIGRGVNSLLDHLAGMIGSVMEGAMKLTEQSDRQRRSATELATNATAQQEAVAGAREDLQKISVSVDDTAAKADATKQAASDVNLLAQQGSSAIDHAVEAMKDIEQQANRIATVVEMINEVSSKTNMLAINAAVEAARAGEHGRGFAIVAEEVRNLANTTQGMADEIVQKVRRTEDAIKRGVDTVSTANEALGQIETSAAMAEASMVEIHHAAELQSKQAAALVSTIEEIARLGAHNREVAQATAEGSSALAEETKRLSSAAQAYKAGQGAPVSETFDKKASALKA